MTATKETLEDYTLRFAPRSYLRRTDDGIDLPMYDAHGNRRTSTCAAMSAITNTNGRT